MSYIHLTKYYISGVSVLMAKRRKAIIVNRRSQRNRGCSILAGLVLLICGGLYAIGQGGTARVASPTVPPNPTQHIETLAAGDIPQTAKPQPTTEAPVQDARRATQFVQLTVLAAISPTATITDTPGVANAPPEVWYMARTGNLRSCPRIDCDQVAQLTAGTPVTLVGLVHGEMYLSSDIWRCTDRKSVV